MLTSPSSTCLQHSCNLGTVLYGPVDSPFVRTDLSVLLCFAIARFSARFITFIFHSFFLVIVEQNFVCLNCILYYESQNNTSNNSRLLLAVPHLYNLYTKFLNSRARSLEVVLTTHWTCQRARPHSVQKISVKKILGHKKWGRERIVFIRVFLRISIPRCLPPPLSPLAQLREPSIYYFHMVQPFWLLTHISP